MAQEQDTFSSRWRYPVELHVSNISLTLASPTDCWCNTSQQIPDWQRWKSHHEVRTTGCTQCYGRRNQESSPLNRMHRSPFVGNYSPSTLYPLNWFHLILCPLAPSKSVIELCSRKWFVSNYLQFLLPVKHEPQKLSVNTQSWLT